MTEILSPELQSLAANAICHAAEMCQRSIQSAVSQYDRPSVIYRPTLSRDGNQWCVLLGENIQEGLTGFGETPAKAMWDFDVKWDQKEGG